MTYWEEYLCKKIIIKGLKVKDVEYRLFLLDKADEFGVSHLNAKNIDELDEDRNQTVEVFVGEDRDAVDNFVEFIKDIKKKENYPKNAIVESVEVINDDYKGYIRTTESFSRWLSNSQLYKMIEIGNTMIGKHDTMIGKQDTMIGKQDTMIGKQDTMIGKQDETIEEIRDLREDLKSYFDKRFDKLEKDVFQIKKKIKMAV